MYFHKELKQSECERPVKINLSHKHYTQVHIVTVYPSEDGAYRRFMLTVFSFHRLCGYYSPSEHLTFLSSSNVMLVTMATNEMKNYPGFRAKVSQVKRGSKGRN